MKKIILLLLAFMLTACSFGTSSELDKNLQKWQDFWRYTLSLFAQHRMLLSIPRSNAHNC